MRPGAATRLVVEGFVGCEAPGRHSAAAAALRCAEYPLDLRRIDRCAGSDCRQRCQRCRTRRSHGCSRTAAWASVADTEHAVSLGPAPSAAPAPLMAAGAGRIEHLPRRSSVCGASRLSARRAAFAATHAKCDPSSVTLLLANNVNASTDAAGLRATAARPASAKRSRVAAGVDGFEAAAALTAQSGSSANASSSAGGQPVLEATARRAYMPPSRARSSNCADGQARLAARTVARVSEASR